MPRGRPSASSSQLARARALQQRLEDRRVERELELEDLAHRAMVNRRTLDKYFQGDSPSPSFFLIAALAQALGLSLDELAAPGRSGGR